MDLKTYMEILAVWADKMPIQKLYIFGSRVRGDATVNSDIDVAIEFNFSATRETMDAWMIENETDFSALKRILDCQLSLHADLSDVVWPTIWEGAKAPVCSVGKVICVLTPKKPV